ncbi:MAG: phosphoribosylanthranilate isomerase [bacterium]
MVKVKICGITNLEDALMVCESGADALGFIFYQKSPRYINPAAARAMMQSLPPFITKVGVFVNMSISDLHEICEKVPLNVIQLHGDETPEYCQQITLPCLKVFRVNDGFHVQQLTEYQTAGFLLDTFSHDHYGGTGETFDWNVAKEAKKIGKIVLSGGLHAGNILQAVNLVQPYAVDVCSGVESYPGKKDAMKVKALFEEIRK